MVHVIADELVPESHSGGNERPATVALLARYALMIMVDGAFG
jgi:zinc transporter ZupT